ncbi:MAG: hypothetical protein M1817_006031 [Caeruleum heppii]|nr:MAG: hypothetical protein M1817_006031 [Caeruleum heppii]
MRADQARHFFAAHCFAHSRPSFGSTARVILVNTRMVVAEAARSARSAGHAIDVYKKYTVQSHGIWDRIRRVLAVAPNRSTGVPLNPQFRNPPPGAANPLDYDDPTTVPAADIAENPYWKRDIRRSYPRASVLSQGDVVGLLSVGSKATPKEDVLLIGEAGTKQLVEVKKEGEEKGLATFFQKDKKGIASVLGPGGLPPLPSGLSPSKEGKRYEIDRENGFPEEYVHLLKLYTVLY